MFYRYFWLNGWYTPLLYAYSFVSLVQGGKKECDVGISGLSKCAVTLWLLDHERLWASLRLQHTVSHSVCFLLSFKLTFTPTHTCHRSPLAPLLRFCLAFRQRHSAAPHEDRTGTVPLFPVLPVRLWVKKKMLLHHKQMCS